MDGARRNNQSVRGWYPVSRTTASHSIGLLIYGMLFLWAVEGGLISLSLTMH